MKKAFSDVVVHSSNVDNHYSSEDEEDPLQLSKNDVKKYLKNIPPFNSNPIAVESRRILGNFYE